MSTHTHLPSHMYLNPDWSRYDCGICGELQVDPLDEFYRDGRLIANGHFHVNGQSVCGACVKFCEVCGEFVDDATKIRGPHVRFRGVVNALTDAHADCAAGEVLSLLCGEALDLDGLSRDEIAEIVVLAMYPGVQRA